MLKIDKNIPLPMPRIKYNFLSKMEIGDSVFIALDVERRGCHYAAVSMHGRKYGKRFTSKYTTERGLKGFRTWRTA